MGKPAMTEDELRRYLAEIEAQRKYQGEQETLWRHMRKAFLFVMFCSLFASSTVLVTVTPSPVTVNSGGKQQFVVTITGASKGANLSVYWTASPGVISSSGLYTAPTVAINTAATVRATRTTHRLQSGTAAVNITPLVVTQHQVTLTWLPATGAVSSNLYRGTIQGGPYALVASALQTPSYVDQTVISGQNYFYVVTDSDAAGAESGYSNEVPAAIP
jgi:hypothetical protein